MGVMGAGEGFMRRKGEGGRGRKGYVMRKGMWLGKGNDSNEAGEGNGREGKDGGKQT